MIKHVAMGLIVNDRGQILLAFRRPSQTRPNMYEIAGGRVEDGESHEETVVRELREELGIETEVISHIASCELDLEVKLNLHCYAVRIVSGEPRPIESAKLLWTTIDYAIVNLPCVPSTYLFYRAIKEYIGK